MKKIIITFLALIHFLCISVFADTNFNWMSYLQELEKGMKYNWHPPTLNYATKVIAKFNVKKTGEITDIKIIKSSNNEKMDNVAIEAIEKASWLHPLPSNCSKEQVSVEFTFDYNIKNTINRTSK